MYCFVQVIFQHYFNGAMEDIAEQVTNEQCFSVEFEKRKTFRFMSVRIWKGSDLCRVFVCRSALPTTNLTGELGCLARLLSVTSTRVDIVACSGDPTGLIQTLNQSSFFNRGIQTCFRFDSLDLPTLMHKLSYSVFGKIDFFSVLQALVISLGNSNAEPWALKSTNLSRVSRSQCNWTMGLEGVKL